MDWLESHSYSWLTGSCRADVTMVVLQQHGSSVTGQKRLTRAPALPGRSSGDCKQCFCVQIVGVHEQKEIMWWSKEKAARPPLVYLVSVHSCWMTAPLKDEMQKQQDCSTFGCEASVSVATRRAMINWLIIDFLLIFIDFLKKKSRLTLNSVSDHKFWYESNLC